MRAASVTLRIYAGDKDTGTGLMWGTLPTTPIGVNLHIVAVTARSGAVMLATSTNYFYDLSFDSEKASIQAAVGYSMGLGGFARPSFALPPADLNNLRIIHGSCRKPHGHGVDELVTLKGLIAGTAATPDKRPHMLLLNGDQIYADDVADSLLMMLTEAGEFLLDPPGVLHEVIPAAGTEDPHLAAQLPPYSRDELLVTAGFSSDDRRSHLMTLGEFFAMYLFVWSEVLWPQSGHIPQPADVHGVVKTSDNWTKGAFLVNRDNIAGDVKAVERFMLGLSAVRIALANVPCYMICDDHEVTDDWNMSHRFCRDVYGAPMGIHIVRNALTAFAVCQAWGNDPTQFSDASQPGWQLLELIPTQKYSSSPDIAKLLGMHVASDLDHAGTPYRVFHEAPPQSLTYNFVIEGPKFCVVVTDSRTWRAFPDPDLDSHAQLIATAQIPVQMSLPGGRLLKRDELLFLVVTTNFPPIASIRYAGLHPERVGVGKFSTSTDVWGTWTAARRGWSMTQRAVYELDLNDSWRFPSLQADRMIAQASKLFAPGMDGILGQVVVLSGDVHFGFAARLAYWIENQRLGDPGPGVTGGLVLAQLVSSGFKNENDMGIGLSKDGYAYAPNWLAGKFVPDNVPEGYAGWNYTASSSKVVGRLDGATLTISKNAPTLETPLDFFVELEFPPDYRYRLDYLTAVGYAPGGWIPPPIPNARSPRAWASNYAASAAALRAAQSSGITFRQVIGHNNLGDVTLSWDANDFDKRVVYQTLYWHEEPDPTHLNSRQYAVTLSLDNDAIFPKIKAGRE